MRFIVPLLVLSLAACSEEAPPAAETNNMQTEAPEAAAEAVPSIEGQWQVTQIRGNPLQQAYAMNVDVGDDLLRVTSDCVNIGFNYTQDRNLVTFTRAPVEGCGRGLNSDEELAEKSIGGANIAMFSDGGNQVELSGSGGSLTMTRR